MFPRLVSVISVILILVTAASAQNALTDPLPDLSVAALGVSAVEVSNVGKEFFKATNTESQHPKSGVVVRDVVANSPAAKAQIQKFDIITHVHNKLIKTEEDYSSTIRELEIGKKYNVTFFRQIDVRGKVTWRKGSVKVELVALRDMYLNAMRQEVDKVTDITCYKPQHSSRFVNDRSDFYCCVLSPKGEKPQLRLHFQYVAEEWLFIRRVVIKADDKSFTLDDFGFSGIKTDNGNGKVWEWHDRPVGVKEREMLNAIATASRVIVRYEGSKYHHDRDLSVAEVERIFTALIAYRIMSEQ